MYFDNVLIQIYRGISWACNPKSNQTEGGGSTCLIGYKTL